MGSFFAALSERRPTRDPGSAFEALFREHFGMPEEVERTLHGGR
jgi:hypothetical protein